MANYKILSEPEIRAALAELPDWSLKAPNIEARFELKTFRDAIAQRLDRTVHHRHGVTAGALERRQRVLEDRPRAQEGQQADVSRPGRRHRSQ